MNVCALLKFTENFQPWFKHKTMHRVESRVLRISLLCCHRKSLESDGSSKRAVHVRVIVNCIQWSNNNRSVEVSWSDIRKKINNFMFFCTSTDNCDMDIGSEINIILFNLRTTLFYLDICFEAWLFSNLLRFELWLKQDLVQNKKIQVRGYFPNFFQTKYERE